MGKKLLVADDSATIQKVIRLALSSEGYDILAVADGKEAVKAIQQEKPQVVLIDVALPLGDAYSVKTQINQMGFSNDVRFILMTSAFEKIDEAQATAVHFDARLTKPFDPSHLRKTVQELLRSVSSSAPSLGAPVEIEKHMPPPMEITLETEMVIIQPNGRQPTAENFPGALPSEISSPAISGQMSGEIEIGPSALAPPVFDFTAAGDNEPIEFIAPPPAPEILEISETPETKENDIRDLTQSTIKMSGLDDFEWSLDDSKKRKAAMTKPSFTPPSKTLSADAPIDGGGSNFLSMGLKADLAQLGKSSNWSSAPPFPPAEYTPTLTPRPQPSAPVPAPKASPVESATTQISNQISKAEIEKLVREELRNVLGRMVPEIAESILKAEIEKLLSE